MSECLRMTQNAINLASQATRALTVGDWSRQDWNIIQSSFCLSLFVVFFLAPNNIFFENDDADPVYLNIPNMPNNTSALGLSISCQNVRSFNISTKNDITQKKIIAIASLKSDIVFLSDIRLNSTKQISAKHDLEKKFFLSGYKLFHNSSLPSRGVGILIKNSLLESKFEVLDLQQTADCNALVMKVKFKGKNLLLVSIYGPNHDTEVVFF